jgi:hypothetical protein
MKQPQRAADLHQPSPVTRPKVLILRSSSNLDLFAFLVDLGAADLVEPATGTIPAQPDAYAD